MSRSRPQLRLRPRPSRPYSAPTKMPDRMLCASSDALGSVKPGMARRSASVGEQPGAAGRHLLRPDDDPLAVLHLLDAHQVVAEIAHAVETELALDGVDAVGLEEGADLLVVEALAADDAGLEDLPGGPRGRRLRLDRGVGEAGLGRALPVEAGELGAARVRDERLLVLE